MECKYLKYGIQGPQQINTLVLENIVRRKQETRKIFRRQGSSNKHRRKKAKQEQVIQGNVQEL